MEATSRLGKGLGVLRIVLGFGFLYAGLDKVVHFDGSTKAFSAAGFLKGASVGTLPGSAEGAVVNPTHDIWVAMAGNAGLMSAINVLVVSGEILIGAALILGLLSRFTGLMGALMMALFWVANWDFAHGVVNEQLLYLGISAVVAYAGAGAFALDSVVAKSAILKRAPVLRYALG